MSVVLHGIIAAIFFCITTEFTPTRIAIASRDDRPIVVVPFARSIVQKSSGKNKLGTASQPKIAQNKLVRKKGTTIATAPDISHKKKQVVVKKQKKEVSATQSQAVTKQEKKKDEPVVTQAVKEIKNPVAPVQDSNPHTSTTTADDEEVIYMGQQEFDELQVGFQVRTALSDHWQRPAGIGTVTCSFRVTIGEDGKAVRIEDEVLSKILVFDIAARMAIEQTTFPKRVVGKTVVLDFT